MNARTQLVTPVARSVCALTAADRREMYALFERYYDGTTYEGFDADLGRKDRVLLLRDETGALCGFSTLAVYQREYEGMPLRVIFSGDTVVDERHWGQQALAFSWLRVAGELKSAQPQLPLYWLLISKGHRTFRYLGAFSRQFHPMPGVGVGTQAALRGLADYLARDRFGAAYDAGAGVLRFARTQGHLNARYAAIPQAHRRLPDVAYFLSRNPGYARGEELVCLCELSADNLQPMARRAFLAGASTQCAMEAAP
jgi:hypothetical protein